LHHLSANVRKPRELIPNNSGNDDEADNGC
jgi:hypothetical protein